MSMVIEFECRYLMDIMNYGEVLKNRNNEIWTYEHGSNLRIVNILR